MPIWGGMIFWIYLLLLIDWELNDLLIFKKKNSWFLNLIFQYLFNWRLDSIIIFLFAFYNIFY